MSLGSASPRRLSAPATLLCLGLVATSAPAQTDWRRVAVPIYGAQAYAQGEATFLAQRAQRFATQAQAFAETMARYCAGEPSVTLAQDQAQWKRSVEAWDALAAHATGPLIERRSARHIDFPLREANLRRAIADSPTTLQDLESIGAPARGFSALEWLLWRDTPRPNTPACHYAVLLGQEIEGEARALDTAARTRADTPPEDDDEAVARLAESLNQWLAGIEQLRWTYLRKPLEVAETRGQTPAFPRALSGHSAASWASRWKTLRDAAVLGARPVPQLGKDFVPFEPLLRGRGLNALADRLVAATQRADVALDAVDPVSADRVRAAASALGELAQFTEDELAPALSVRMGFSDADGA